jgi:hypothetical protein
VRPLSLAGHNPAVRHLAYPKIPTPEQFAGRPGTDEAFFGWQLLRGSFEAAAEAALSRGGAAQTGVWYGPGIRFARRDRRRGRPRAALRQLARAMVNGPRLASARSKVGPSARDELLDEVILDVMVDLSAACVRDAAVK